MLSGNKIKELALRLNPAGKSAQIRQFFAGTRELMIVDAYTASTPRAESERAFIRSRPLPQPQDVPAVGFSDPQPAGIYAYISWLV